jgi:hypothetical protein
MSEVSREEFEKAFEQVVTDMVAIMKRKNNDYSGGDPLKNFRRHGANGILVRMEDKMCRLDTLTSPAVKQQVSDESVEDTAQDLAVYSILFILARRYLKPKDEVQQLRDKMARRQEGVK